MVQKAFIQAQKQAQSSTSIASGLLQSKCDNCRKKKPALQRAASGPSQETVPPIVHEVLRSPGAPLDTATRAFFEPRFGHDFSRVRLYAGASGAEQSGMRLSQPDDRSEQEADRVADAIMKMPRRDVAGASGAKPMADLDQVRIHTGARATEAARAVNARAFAFGNQIVFGEGQFAPHTSPGQRLLAHELAHIVQGMQADSSAVHAKVIQRRVDEARVSCASLPRSYPIFTAIGTEDPVGVLVEADARAIEMLDNAIAVLSDIRARVQAGEPPAWPLISDALAQALRSRLRLNADDPNVWTGNGPGTIEIIIRWYTNVRATLNSGRVRYICLGPTCEEGDWARTIPGIMRIRLCRLFWPASVDNRALTLIHEAAHIYYGLEDTGGGAGNAACLEQFMADMNGVEILPGFVGACRPPR